MLNRVNFYIDGFNYYHRLDLYQKIKGKCYKWLNYHSLCSSFLLPNQTLNKIYFFTAVTDYFGKGSSDRHKKYIKSLRNKNIEIVQGYFRIDKNKRKPVEKQTDANIVAYLIEGAFINEYDVAFIMSGDSDLVPAIKVIKRNQEIAHKQIGFVPPPFEGRKRHGASNPLAIQNTSELNAMCDFQKNLQFKTLEHHLFPDKIYDNKGGIIVEMPVEYKNK